MVHVVYIDPEGTRRPVDAPEGLSLMAAAAENSRPGIDGDCGGACACAPCPGYVAPGWGARLPPQSEMEETMLGFSPHGRPESRLSCPLRMSAALDGIVLRLPKSQH